MSYPMAPLIRLTLICLYLALVAPLPWLAPAESRAGVGLAVGLGLALELGLPSWLELAGCLASAGCQEFFRIPTNSWDSVVNPKDS